MDRLVLAGGLMGVLGVVGYVAGIYAPYPGRSFSVTALMVGITLLAIGSADAEVAE